MTVERRNSGLSGVGHCKTYWDTESKQSTGSHQTMLKPLSW